MKHKEIQAQYKADLEAKRWCMYVPKHERPVLSALLTLCLVGGNKISIHNGEEWVVKQSKDPALCRSQLGHSEEDTIRIRSKDGEELGFFYLIYNNGSEGDPMVVISDYSDNEMCNSIWHQLDTKYST